MLTNADEQCRGAAMFWFVQGDAAAGVEAVDEYRRRRSSGALECCKEEDEDEKAKGESEKRTRGPIYKAGRISGMRGNRETRKWICDGTSASIFGSSLKEKIY